MLSKQIDFFVDDKNVHPGNKISPILLKAIEESFISLVIFSEQYAYSKWCMEELVKITESMKQYKRIVMPVFYHVEPYQVRHQKGTFADAFDDHKNKYKVKKAELQKWRSVLKEIANISGNHYPSPKYEHESELIEEIVKEISEKLPDTFSNASQGLIGIDENFKFLRPLMAIESDEEVRIVGIWGMGGIGKSTIAKALFDKYASRYEGSSILCVKEELENCSRHSLYEKLFSQLLGGEYHLVNGPQARLEYVRRRLNRKKVLIVLDGVDTLDMLEYLTREQIFLAPGSRVIVTTRDKHLLVAARVHEIHKVQGLSFKSSLELFCIKAFNKSYPENGYEELSEMAVEYADGIPLALEVLGSCLCSSRNAEVWKSALTKLKAHPDRKIFQVLKMSYDGLDEFERNIFLDIAFFFKGECIYDVIRFLDSCGFYPEIEISNLERKALIIISLDNRLKMHDLIQQMGWEVVRQESNNDASKLTRINRPEDFDNLLENSEVKNLVEGIMIDLSQIKKVSFNDKAFKNMPRLRFLKLYNSSGERLSHVIVPTTLETFSKKLRYLEWHEYPLSSMPSAFCADKLIELRMPGSKITKLWDGVQDLVNLKIIDLSECQQLVELPDLSTATNLEGIDISDCKVLCQLHPYIISFPTLKYLRFHGCKKLKSFKGEIRSKSLRELDFKGCSSLEEFSLSSPGQLNTLIFGSSGIWGFENDRCCLKSLEKLDFSDCRGMMELPHNGIALSRLQALILKGCRSLASIPELPLSISISIGRHADTSKEAILFNLKAISTIKWSNLMNRRRRSGVGPWNTIEKDAGLTILKKILLMSARNGILWGSNKIDKWFSCHVCYPGSEVAKWFRCQTAEGASITVEIDQPYNQLLGFFVSCVVSQEFSPYYQVCCEYDLGEGEKYPLGSYELRDLRERWSTDHVCLWFHSFYNSRIMRAIERCVGSYDHGTTWNKTILFTFTAEGLASAVSDMFIKGCGVLPIYASDVLQLIPKLELEWKGLHQEEEEEEERRRRRRIILQSNSSSDEEEEERRRRKKKTKKKIKKNHLQSNSSSDEEEEERRRRKKKTKKKIKKNHPSIQ
ncbi:hypothetical protein PIB30_046127 [Stylosanthes scabra]|uniref:TIR domain-containing protein n=1 Tax=Stylosanthes scabra TaxID=79078 RepID=A0ABU6QH61_9FABA|nr:hypothetical protein [Stylosanthes scabra]